MDKLLDLLEAWKQKGEGTFNGQSVLFDGYIPLGTILLQKRTDLVYSAKDSLGAAADWKRKGKGRSAL